MTRPWRQFSHNDLHRLLCDRSLSDGFKAAWQGAQALFCPYYVTLEGKLGDDWGVIVNPESSRFGQLVFEHDDCGCPTSDTEDGDGSGRHAGSPQQEGDMWWEGWVHRCDKWCDPPCESAEQWGAG